MWRMNRNGRTYKNGQALSTDMRTLIIDKITERGGNRLTGATLYGTYSSVAGQLNVSKQTVVNVWERFVQDGTVERRPSAGGMQSHLTEADLELVELVKKTKPSTTLKEMKDLLDDFGEIPGGTSVSSIQNAIVNRMPSGEKYSFKKMQHIAQERFTLENMAYTQLYLNYLHQKDPAKLKFFDECGLKLPTHGKRNYGHAPIGERCIEFERYTQTANVTVNLMCGLAGVAYMNIIDGGADTLDFLEFFGQAAEAENIYGRPALEVGDIVVMDNCPTHHNLGGDVLKEFLSNMNIELVYMPAYSPDFNPAELVFCKIRTVMRYELLYLTKLNLKYSAYSAAEMITPQDMEGFFKSTSYLNL